MTPEALGEKMLHYFRTAGSEGSEERDLPSFVRFAQIIGTTVGAMRRFREQNTAFADVWTECEEILCDRIVNGALHRRLDGSFAKFLLSSRFGFAEKAETENTPFDVEILLKEPPPTS